MVTSSEPLSYDVLKNIAQRGVPVGEPRGLDVLDAGPYRTWCKAREAHEAATRALERAQAAATPYVARARANFQSLRLTLEDCRIALDEATRVLVPARRASLAKVTPPITAAYAAEISKLQVALTVVDDILGEMARIEGVSKCFVVDGGGNIAPARHALSGLTVSELIRAGVNHWRATLARVVGKAA
jgi:hypothetical protein